MIDQYYFNLEYEADETQHGLVGNFSGNTLYTAYSLSSKNNVNEILDSLMSMLQHERNCCFTFGMRDMEKNHNFQFSRFAVKCGGKGDIINWPESEEGRWNAANIEQDIPVNRRTLRRVLQSSITRFLNYLETHSET
jgi:hypothetical protein